MRRLGSLAIDLDRCRVDGLAKLHATMRRELLSQIKIEPQADRFWADDSLEGRLGVVFFFDLGRVFGGEFVKHSGSRGMTKTYWRMSKE